MIGCVTQEARATMEKRRKKREREDRARMLASDAHAAAEGATGHVTDEDEDCPPDMGKAYQDIGISDGPGSPVMPGQVSPQDFGRPYIQAGHGAPSPGYQAPNVPNVPHVDLRGDRGMARPLSPHAPLPVEGPR